LIYPSDKLKKTTQGAGQIEIIIQGLGEGATKIIDQLADAPIVLSQRTGMKSLNKAIQVMKGILGRL